MSFLDRSAEKPVIFPVRQNFAADDFEFGEMIEFSFARKHVEVKHAQRFAGGGIGHDVKLKITNPFVGRGDLFEFQTEDALVNVEPALEHSLEWEISAEHFRVDVVFLFFELVRVVAPVPDVDRRVRIVCVRGFHFSARGDFCCKFRLDARNEIVDVRFRASASLGHFNFSLIILP
jgi:hypothetical protein